jgi:hypothetical protein
VDQANVAEGRILCAWRRRLQAAHMPTRTPKMAELATMSAIPPAGSRGLLHFRHYICPARHGRRKRPAATGTPSLPRIKVSVMVAPPTISAADPG